ncbi:MAG TPA: ATP synthase subunit I [Terriglobales bacterium]|nr:ATP synthase subunit I [Terriglobales bacterium]
MSDPPENADPQPSDPNLEPEGAAPTPDPSDPFFAGALLRIRHIAIVLGILSATVVWARFGTAIGVGYAVGCVVSYVNFVWLERVIGAVVNRVTETGEAGSSRGIVTRFLLRYGFIAIACFVILMCFKSSVYGLLGGLFLSVAAILCEAAYEVAVAWHRGA